MMNMDYMKDEQSINDNWERVISAPIRWAGSKSTLLNDLLSTFEKERDNYIEPFLGSGAVLINVLNNNERLGYKHFYVNDSNQNVIGFYKNLKNNPNQFINELLGVVNRYNALQTLDKKEEMYYEARELFNKDIKKNLYFYFLMKACFNGVYRENSKGGFNVPFGRKDKVVCDTEKLLTISKMIKNVKFYCYDYKRFYQKLEQLNAIKKSFVYCDPPYIPDDDSVYKTQTLYSKPLFDHEMFFKSMKDMSNNGSKIIISMSDSKKANDIYNNAPFHKEEVRELLRTVNPRRMLSSKEIIFTNIQ